jgi:FtsH-binding integral membrane protein
MTRYADPTMAAPQSRPRVVTVAFWCWVAAAIALVGLGLLMTVSRANVPMFFRGAGVLFAVAGLVLGYLAGRAGGGHAALRRAAIGLALALGVLLALFTLTTQGALWLIPMILTMVGAILMLRPAAQEWFEHEETQ